MRLDVGVKSKGNYELPLEYRGKNSDALKKGSLDKYEKTTQNGSVGHSQAYWK